MYWSLMHVPRQDLATQQNSFCKMRSLGQSFCSWPFAIHLPKMQFGFCLSHPLIKYLLSELCVVGCLSRGLLGGEGRRGCPVATAGPAVPRPRQARLSCGHNGPGCPAATTGPAVPRPSPFHTSRPTVPLHSPGHLLGLLLVTHG